MSAVARDLPFVAVVCGLLWSPDTNAGPRACAGLHIDAFHWTPQITGSWTLYVDGDAALVTAGEKKHRFRLSEDACADLVRVVRQEEFFALHRTYGTQVIDGGMRSLKIGIGKRQHTVVVPADLGVTPEERAAVKRAVRVWIAVRSLFDVSDADDSREQDRAFLKQ